MAGKLPGRLDYSAGTLHQWGSWAADHIRGDFGTFTLGWTVRPSGWKPRVSGDYNFGSGDRSPNDRRRGIDVLYGTNQPFLSLSGMMGWRNLRALRAGTDFAPTKSIKIQADFRDAYLATCTTAHYGKSGVGLANLFAGEYLRQSGKGGYLYPFLFWSRRF